ncbi:MAG TPA: ChbG/HpnK family deacetylase [Noviherbaspirillum sp.]|nr:ChbG/HpnK family deacetylase [Noviherbaspirillum sp.]
MTHTTIPVALCADDYAQHPGIDAGILALLGLGRLTAVSCFATSPRWQTVSAPALRAHRAQADIGLHFNLTEGFGKPMPSLHAVILRSLLRRLDPADVEQALTEQLDAFEAGFGQPPDFIDGHQHVHQLPGVREVVLKLIRQRYPGHPVWVRNTVPADRSWRGKPQVLKLLGGQSLAAALKRARIASNDGFAGVYGFDKADYASSFKAWLERARPGMLIMCHPAAQAYPNDEIAQQRVVEYRFFTSPRFDEMLAATRTSLVRLSRIASNV